MILLRAYWGTGEKKWIPMKSSCRLDTGRQTSDRQGGGVGTEQRVGLDDVLDLLEHLVLEFLALEHRLDHEVDALEVGGIGCRGDPAEQRLGLFLRGAAPLERLGLQLLGQALPLAAASALTSLSTTSKPALAET